jgi:hypothetical protein
MLHSEHAKSKLSKQFQVLLWFIDVLITHTMFKILVSVLQFVLSIFGLSVGV